jgi:predicted Rossmann-fold nucleotide-binding protein
VSDSITHELRTRADLFEHLRVHGHLRGVVVQELDLRDDAERLATVDASGSAFLGCELDPDTVVHLYRSGADLFPPLTKGQAGALPFRPYRHGLYTVEELYEGFDPAVPGSFWEQARDSKIYAYYEQLRRRTEPPPILDSLALRLHDHAVEDALAALLHRGPSGPRKVVAIMGGHAMTRDEPIFREIATMARALTRAGYFVATGGGPGAMEAGNLGAYLAAQPDPALDEALALLVLDTDYASHDYLVHAMAVRERWPRADGGEHAGESLAVPTWFYGHEPSNLFASHIAKYFANSVREDGLLAIASHGVIFAPGSAGTVQEVFMDACQNHYGTFPLISPMIMLGVEYWTERLPVWPLLQALSRGKPYAELLSLCDTGEAALERIIQTPPIPSRR